MNKLDNAVQWVAEKMAEGCDFWDAVFQVNDAEHVGFGALVQACEEKGI